MIILTLGIYVRSLVFQASYLLLLWKHGVAILNSEVKHHMPNCMLPLTVSSVLIEVPFQIDPICEENNGSHAFYQAYSVLRQELDT